MALPIPEERLPDGYIFVDAELAEAQPEIIEYKAKHTFIDRLVRLPTVSDIEITENPVEQKIGGPNPLTNN